MGNTEMLRGLWLIGLLFSHWVSGGVAIARGPVPDVLVELPGPDLLRRGERELDVRSLARRTGAGIYGNLESASLGCQEVRYRRGVAAGLELAVAGRLGMLAATGVDAPIRAGTRAMPVLGAEVKFRFPDTLFGAHLVFGTGASLISRQDRALFQPDDFARFNPTYALISRRFGDLWRGELVFRRARVFATDRNEGTNLTTFDLGVEFAPPRWPKFVIECLSERLGIRTIGDYGPSLDFDGVTINLGVTQTLGPRTSGQLYARRLNRPDNLEVGLWYGVALEPEPRHRPRDVREGETPGAVTVLPVATLGAYHPSSTRSGLRPQLALGVRLHDPTPYGFGFEFLEYGLLASSWTSPFEVVRTVEAELLAFYPQTPVLACSHHFFYGIGAGGATVERGGAALTSRPIATLSGGLQVHLEYLSLEGRLKLIASPHDPLFDVFGTAAQISASIPLEF